VPDGRTALDFLFGTGRYVQQTRHLPHLILTDVRLPVANSLEPLHVLQFYARTRTIPIVTLVASEADHDP
jgi:two-component system, response regulator